VFRVRLDVALEMRTFARDKQEVAVADRAGKQRRLGGLLPSAVVHLLIGRASRVGLGGHGNRGGARQRNAERTS